MLQIIIRMWSVQIGFWISSIHRWINFQNRYWTIIGPSLSFYYYYCKLWNNSNALSVPIFLSVKKFFFFFCIFTQQNSIIIRHSSNYCKLIFLRDNYITAFYKENLCYTIVIFLISMCSYNDKYNLCYCLYYNLSVNI